MTAKKTKKKAAPDLRKLFARARRDDGLSLRAVATETGIGFTTLSRFENKPKEKPDLRTALAICDYLGLDDASAIAGLRKLVK